VIFGVLVALVLLIVAVIAVALHRLNTPQAVPKSWSPPAALPSSPTAAIPQGNLVFDSNRTGNYQIWTMATNGTGERQLTYDPKSDSWWPQISPDRRSILFYRTPTGVHDRDYSKTSLWAMAADGTDLAELRPAGLDGWVLQGHAEWSPSGGAIVMFGGSRLNPQIWVTDELGEHPREVTHRGGTNIDPSWDPDGRTIVFVGCPSSFCTPADQEVYTVPTNGGAPVRITYDHLVDYDPAFSHDGSALAWLTEMSSGPDVAGTWDIRIIPVAQPRGEVSPAPSSAPRLLLPDISGTVNSKPSWSIDNRTIYFHRGYGDLQRGFQIWAVSPNGTELREITAGQGGSNEYPAT
jgi:Tol biopolymer transport system component